MSDLPPESSLSDDEYYRLLNECFCENIDLYHLAESYLKGFYSLKEVSDQIEWARHQALMAVERYMERTDEERRYDDEADSSYSLDRDSS